MAVTLTLLSASLAGCIGGDDEGDGEYSGPINLVVFYDSTSGMVETFSEQWSTRADYRCRTII